MNRTRLTCLTVAPALAASSLVTARQAPAPQTPPPTPAAAGPAPQGGRGGGPVKSPEIGADQRVTFRLRAPERERGCGVGWREAAADAEGRTGRVERDERSDGAGRLHLLADRRRRLDERPGEPAGADVVRQFPEHVHGAGTRGLASGAGRSARRDRPPRVSVPPSPTTTATSSSTRRPATTRAARSRIPCCISCTASATMPSAG